MIYSNYGKLRTIVYDLGSPLPDDIFQFYLDRSRESAGPVLEAFCGSGRYTIPLLEAGVEVDGFDASEDMIASCERRVAEHGLRSNLYCQLAQELDISRRYGLIIIPERSFGTGWSPRLQI